jgi:hypothetical protein
MLKWPVNLPGDLLDEFIPFSKDIPAKVNQLIGMRGVGNIIHCKDERLWKPAIVSLMLSRIFLDLLENFPVRVYRSDLLFDIGRIKRPFILKAVSK